MKPLSPKHSEVVSLQERTVYYEVYGSGKPLFLLHGYTASSKAWYPYVDEYAKTFEVYLVDLQGHGKSGPLRGNLSIRAAAGELLDLIKHLGFKQIQAIGNSYGGDVLFQLALLDTQLVQSMIVSGSCGTWDVNKFPEWLDFLSYKNIHNLTWMLEHQVNEAQSKILLDQFPDYVTAMSDADLRSIKAKTLFVLGDQDDAISLECISHARRFLATTYLWILPNTGHDAIGGPHHAQFVQVSKNFLAGEWK